MTPLAKAIPRQDAALVLAEHPPRRDAEYLGDLTRSEKPLRHDAAGSVVASKPTTQFAAPGYSVPQGQRPSAPT
jgi:hypothetical protein